MKKIKQLIAVMISVITITSIVAGCAASKTTETASKSSESEQSDKRTVKDQFGTDVELPNNVTKVADLWHANNEIVLLLGGADKLVATTDTVKNMKWFAKVDPDIKDLKAPLKWG